MCGIAGLAGALPPDAEARLDLALDRLRHRGPDGSGTHLGDGVALGMRRLAIIDVAGGSQPIYNEDRRIASVANGEIYNYCEELDRLAGRGHRFQSRSDVNVVPHGYEDSGVEAVLRWRGMFAAALWDEHERRLVLWRDRVGKKPLFYSWRRGTLAFASELPALLALVGEVPELSPDAIAWYLRYGYVPHPLTVYQGILSLPPGAWLRMTSGEPPQIGRYWRAGQAGTTVPSTRAEALDEIEARLDEATGLRLRSDLPVGVFLSGGIDSGLVAAAAVRSGAKDLVAFTVRVPDPELDESALAAATAAHLGLPIETLDLAIAPRDDVFRVATMFGQPFADSSAVPSFALARAAREYRTVVLNGDGGDEVFAGYRRYQVSRWRRIGAMANGRLGGGLAGLMAGRFQRRSRGGFAARALRGFSAPPAERFAIWTTDLFDTPTLAACFPALPPTAARGGLEGFPPPYGTLREMLRADFERLLPDDLLVKMDIATMAASLEGRSPLLDAELIEYVWALPDAWILGGRTTKPLLRSLARRHLPAAVATARKRGFEVPVARWLDGDLRDLVRDLLLAPDAAIRPWADRNAVAALLDGTLGAGGNRPQMIWAVLMLELFLRAGQPAATPVRA